MSEEVKTATGSGGQQVVIRHEVASGGETKKGDDGDKYINRMSRKDFEKQLADAEYKGARQQLKALGIPKDERDAYLAKITAGEYVLAPKPKEGEPDYKVEYEKNRPAMAELEAAKARLTKHTEFFKKLADDEFAKLPEGAQKYLASKKIDDPEARLAEINAMREAGMLTAPVIEGKKGGATTSAAGGPKPTAPTVKNAYEHYENLKKLDPMAAALFRKANNPAIEASRPK